MELIQNQYEETILMLEHVVETERLKVKDILCNMSTSNIDARKERNAKDHLFLINGIINSLIRGDEPCIDVQIYDLAKAFDFPV